MAGGLVPQAIVLALGAGALGGPDALRLLLQFAGRNPASDLALCVVAICVVTTPFLGTMLLARFVRKARAGGGGGGSAPATHLFAQVTATVSVGAAVLVSACLLLAGPGGAVRFPVDFGVVRNPVVVTVTVLVVCAAALPSAAPLLRFFRGAGSVSAGGGGPAAPAAAPATTIKFLAAVSLAVVSAHILVFPESHWRRRMVTLPVPVGAATAIVTVASTMLLVQCCSGRARNAAGAGGAAARTS